MSSLPTVERGSMIAHLQANRKKLLQDQTKVLRVPGWDSLHVRYKRLPWEQARDLFTQFGDTTSDGPKQVGAAIDALIAACETFLFEGEDGEQQELKIGYEQKLAEMIGDDNAVTPAQVVMSLFADDELTLMGHAGEYLAWATRQEEAVAAELGKQLGRTDE